MMNENANANQKDSKFSWIRGWLILPAIGMVLNPIIGVIAVTATLGALRRTISRGYGGYVIPWLILNIGLLVYICITTTRFFKKRSNAPRTVIRLIIARTAASLILFIIGITIIGSDNDLVIIHLLRSNNFVAQGIMAAIWIPYFKLSRRVKETFVH